MNPVIQILTLTIDRPGSRRYHSSLMFWWVYPRDRLTFSLHQLRALPPPDSLWLAPTEEQPTACTMLLLPSLWHGELCISTESCCSCRLDSFFPFVQPCHFRSHPLEGLMTILCFCVEKRHMYLPSWHRCCSKSWLTSCNWDILASKQGSTLPCQPVREQSSTALQSLSYTWTILEVLMLNHNHASLQLLLRRPDCLLGLWSDSIVEFYARTFNGMWMTIGNISKLLICLAWDAFVVFQINVSSSQLIEFCIMDYGTAFCTPFPTHSHKTSYSSCAEWPIGQSVSYQRRQIA